MTTCAECGLTKGRHANKCQVKLREEFAKIAGKAMVGEVPPPSEIPADLGDANVRAAKAYLAGNASVTPPGPSHAPGTKPVTPPSQGNASVTRCAECGKEIDPHYCGDRCRKRAWRKRNDGLEKGPN